MGLANSFPSPCRDETKRLLIRAKKASNTQCKLLAKLMLNLLEFEEKFKEIKKKEEALRSICSPL